MSVYMGKVGHSCELPMKRTPNEDFGTLVQPDFLPDGRRLTRGMRWRCPICFALWGAEIPAPNVFMPRWMKLSSGRAWRFGARMFGKRPADAKPTGAQT